MVNPSGSIISICSTTLKFGKLKRSSNTHLVGPMLIRLNQVMAILKSLVILTIKFLAKEIELSLSLANLMRNMTSLLPVLTRRSTSLNLPRILLSKPMLRDLGITNPYIIDNFVKLTTPEVTTKQGLPAVLFVKEEVLGPLAEVCKYTLIGKFTHTMPKVELIRKSFIVQTQLSGGSRLLITMQGMFI